MTRLFPPVLETVEKEHGRLELRRLQYSTALNEYVEFPYVQQVFRVTRKRTVLKTGKSSIETVYGITSLSSEVADRGVLMTLIRGHWSIENRSHWVRDWNYDEDRSQIRTGNGPQMMACLRNTAISLLRLQGAENIAHELRGNQLKVGRVFKLFGL